MYGTPVTSTLNTVPNRQVQVPTGKAPIGNMFQAPPQYQPRPQPMPPPMPQAQPGGVNPQQMMANVVRGADPSGGGMALPRLETLIRPRQMVR